jgi:hypothetical protein
MTTRLRLSAYFIALSLMSCSENKIPDFYVQTRSTEGTRFINDLSNVAKRLGLAARVGKATDDRGKTLSVLEAKSGLVRVWAQNIPLSEFESEKCGLGQEAQPSPDQFLVKVTRRLPWIGDRSSQKISEGLQRELRGMGYIVSPSPELCELRELR